MKKAVCFDDVLLQPQYSTIRSRTEEVNISSSLGDGLEFSIPVISSPMDTVTGPQMARAIEDYGGLGVIHRYNTPQQQVELVRSAHSLGTPIDRLAVAIGVGDKHIDRARLLYDAGVRIFCADIAHGHHVLMKTMLTRLREIFGDTVHIMAGNVATLSGFNDLADWGADSIRVGIGGGSICSTRVQTGHGIPTLESIMMCAKSDRNAKLIADGGIRTSGDIVKSLAAGADFVMLGSFLAGHAESPGDVIVINGESRMTYRGMASKDAQIAWRGHTASIEGVSSTVPYRGSLLPRIEELSTGIRSGFSYSGARTLRELQAKARFIHQTSSSVTEGLTHIDVRR